MTQTLNPKSTTVIWLCHILHLKDWFGLSNIPFPTFHVITGVADSIRTYQITQLSFIRSTNIQNETKLSENQKLLLYIKKTDRKQKSKRFP